MSNSLLYIIELGMFFTSNARSRLYNTTIMTYWKVHQDIQFQPSELRTNSLKTLKTRQVTRSHALRIKIHALLRQA